MEKERKIKIISIVTLVIAILGLTIAFASLSKTLNIKGKGTLDAAKWDIKFKNLNLLETNGDASIISEAKINNSDITKVENIKVNLKTPGDSAYYTVDLANEGDINAEIESINKTDLSDNKLLTFKVYYTESKVEVSIGDKLNSDEVKNITIAVIYNKDINEEDLYSEDTTIDLSYEIVYRQAEDLIAEDLNKPPIVSNEGLTYSFANNRRGNAGGTITLNEVGDYTLYWADDNGPLADWTEIKNIENTNVFGINDSVLIPVSATKLIAKEGDDVYATVDLPTRKLAQEEAPIFSFMGTGDFHVGTIFNYQYVFLNFAQNHKDDVDFCVMNGDTLSEPTSTNNEYEAFVQKTSSYELPQMYYVQGNHEYKGAGLTQLNQLNNRENEVPYFSIVNEGVKFIFAGPDTVGSTLNYYYSSSQLQWLENELNTTPNDMPIFLFTHIPFDGLSVENDDVSPSKSSYDIRHLIKNRANVTIVSNHTHNAIIDNNNNNQSGIIDNDNLYDAIVLGSIKNNSDKDVVTSNCSIIEVFSEYFVRTGFDLTKNGKRIPLAYVKCDFGVNQSNTKLNDNILISQGSMTAAVDDDDQDVYDKQIRLSYVYVKPNTTYNVSVKDGYKIRLWYNYNDKLGPLVTSAQKPDSKNVTIQTDSNTYALRFTIQNDDYSNITPDDDIGFTITEVK